MKSIGQVTNRNDADTFQAYLSSIGIEAIVDPVVDETASGHDIWVYEIDKLAVARSEFHQFVIATDLSKYRTAAQAYRKECLEAAFRKQQTAKRVSRQALGPFIDQLPVTVFLVLACAAMFIAAELQVGNLDWSRDLTFSNASHSETFSAIADGQRHWLYHTNAPELQDGEFWRLVTPILLHKSLPHVFFNLLWLLQFGSAIEYRKGSWRLAGLVVVIAVLSNVAQFTQTGANFVGISGVDAGLFGYLFATGRLSPQDDFGADRKTAIVMFAYLGLCLTPVIPDAANWSHMIGLATGAVVAAIEFASVTKAFTLRTLLSRRSGA